MKCPNCDAENKDDSLYCTSCGIRMKSLLDPVGEDFAVLPDMEYIAEHRKSSPAKMPACQICGRQDETLRVVAFPYIISLVFVTFRRQFSGVWCQKHQNQFLFLASLLTSTIGWIGIPFGFIFSPLALFTLAKGGKLPGEVNAKLLSQLADHKEANGDTEGARKCLEQSLKYHEDRNLQTRTRLKRFTTHRKAEMNVKTALLQMALLFMVALGLGTLIGMLDYAFGDLSNFLFPGEVSILVAILTWVPLVALGFIGGLLLFQQIERSFTKISLTSVPVAVLVSTLVALIAAYSIFEGIAIADLVSFILFRVENAAVLDMIFVGLYTILVGGFNLIQAMFQTPTTSDTIYLAILLIMTGYYLGFATQKGIDTATRQKKLTE